MFTSVNQSIFKNFIIKNFIDILRQESSNLDTSQSPVIAFELIYGLWEGGIYIYRAISASVFGVSPIPFSQS